MYTGKKDLVKKSLLIGIMIAGLFAVLQFQSVYSEENASNEIINGTHLESEKQNDVSNVGEEDSNSTSSSPSSASSLPNSNESTDNDGSEGQNIRNNSSVNIRLEQSTSGTSNNQVESDVIEIDNQSIQVNDSTISIPENGRIRETIKDENSTTRIRADIDIDGSSSIDISTKNENN